MKNVATDGVAVKDVEGRTTMKEYAGIGDTVSCNSGKGEY